MGKVKTSRVIQALKALTRSVDGRPNWFTANEIWRATGEHLGGANPVTQILLALKRRRIVECEDLYDCNGYRLVKRLRREIIEDLTPPYCSHPEPYLGYAGWGTLPPSNKYGFVECPPC